MSTCKGKLSKMTILFIFHSQQTGGKQPEESNQISRKESLWSSTATLILERYILLPKTTLNFPSNGPGNPKLDFQDQTSYSFSLSLQKWQQSEEDTEKSDMRPTQCRVK